MPYIKKEDRTKYDSLITDVVDELTDHGFKAVVPGEMNYVFSKIIWEIFRKNPSYTVGNNMIGALECVKQEFYRRQLAEYENDKIDKNGDI